MMNIPVMIYQDAEGNYLAESSFLPGFHTYGKDRKELDANVEELTGLYSEMLQAWEVKPVDI